MIDGPVATYESNIAYELRFMIDKAVSFFAPDLCTTTRTEN